MYLSLFCYPCGVVVQNRILRKPQAFQDRMDTVRIFVGTVVTEENYIFKVCMFVSRIVPESKMFQSVFSP